MTRPNPFADLSDFDTKPKAELKQRPVAKEQIDRVAEENNFPSRQPARPSTKAKPRRRSITLRDQQLNMKVTKQIHARFYQHADEKRIPLGELLERMMDAYEREEAKQGINPQSALPLR